jgi:hypothetical protein
LLVLFASSDSAEDWKLFVKNISQANHITESSGCNAPASSFINLEESRPAENQPADTPDIKLG